MSRVIRLWPALLFVATASMALSAQTSAPVQPRQLRANDVDLEYVEQGKGVPVVFAHGAVGDLRFWEPQREAIAKRHRFVAYTYRYHGSKPWPDEAQRYSDETHAADLAAFIAALDAGPVHLVGLSYGGLVAALVGMKQPALVRTLTLAEPALFSVLAGLPEGQPVLEAWGKSTAPMIAAMKAGDAVAATKHLVAIVNGEPIENFEKLPPALRQLLLDNARTLGPLFAAPPPNVSCEMLRTLKMPTLIVRGERTPDMFVKTNEAAGRCIAGSRQVVIPGASHAMSYENPAAFNAAILKFVEEHR